MRQSITATELYQVLDRSMVCAGVVLLLVGCSSRQTDRMTNHVGALVQERSCPTLRSFRRLTSTGAVTSVAISEDGRHVAWVNGTGVQRQSSVWLQDRGGVPVELRSGIAGVEYRFVTLSPDASHVYFVSASHGTAPKLFDVSPGGGEARLVAEHVHSAAAVSRDGRKLAFIRAATTSASIVTLNSDGTGERVAASAPERQAFAQRRPAWSPDGRRLACYSVKPPGIVIVDVMTGVVERLGGQRWAWGNGLAWLNETILVAAATAEGVNGGQVWCVNANSGEATALTRGLTNFADLGIAWVGPELLVAQHGVQSGNLWRVPIRGGAPVQLTTNPTEGDVDGYAGISVFQNGDVLFGLLNGTGMAVLRNGKRERILSPPRGEAYGWPAISRDGKVLAFVARDTENVSRIRLADSDGSNIRSVAGLPAGATFPQFSPNDESLVYTQDGPTPSVWKIPLAGGSPTRIADWASSCAVSPDGSNLACFVRGGLGVIPMTGGAPTKIYPAVGAAAGGEPPIRWTHDGTGVLVKGLRDGQNIVWLQPLDGGPPRPVVQFPPGWIYSFDVTPVGESVIASYGVHNTDAVLITTLQ